MPTTNSGAKTLLCAACLSLSLAAAAAADGDPMGIYVDGGQAAHGRDSTDSLTIGLAMPWAIGLLAESRTLSFYWDFFLSQWRGPLPKAAGNHSYTQVGVIANLRYRFAEGESPWFAEAGIGGTVMDDLYQTPSRDFSTRFQFTEQIGFGRSFGPQRQHELSFRVQHFSNAGIKEPNPGENFFRLRYLYRF